MMTKMPAVLSDLAAHIRLSHRIPTHGMKILAIKARWCVNTRSTSGDVIAAATRPLMSNTAPKIPHSVEE